MNRLEISVCILLLSVFISSVSQIILKKAAGKVYDSTLKEYLNPMVIGAYAMFFCSVILTMIALKYVPLSMSPILESTGYIFVSVMGYFFLKERFSKRSGKVIAGRNIHAAAVNAMALLGLEPAWVYPRRDAEERLIGRIAPADVAAALQRESDICAVYITSPDYFGVMSDIEGIAEVAHAHGVPLLVDNAHGAHLRFLQGEDGCSLHPMQLGADLCCDSLHKTLPALTGAALLHCNREEYVPQLKGAMTVFGSTSPNYLIMLSIDSTAAFLLKDGPDQLRRTVRKWGELRRLAREQGYPIPEHCDPMRLTLPLADSGYTAEEFKALLHERRIMEEYCSDSGCVLLFSPFNREEDFARVRQFLLDCPVRQKGSFTPFPIVPSQRVMGLRQALFAPKESVDIDKAEGRISAQVKITCPPGIPLVMP